MENEKINEVAYINLSDIYVNEDNVVFSREGIGVHYL